MLGLDLNHMVINKWNPISFNLAFKVEPFLLAHPKWLLDFQVYCVLEQSKCTVLYSLDSWNGNQTIWDKDFSCDLG